VTRLPFIDWARGFAVVAMVLWHTGDAWLRLDQRDGQFWVALRFVGGLAAPSFLLLAGCAAALAARPSDDREQTSRALRTSLSRGLEVLLIGYALRLQTWLLDAAAATQIGLARAWLPIVVGYAALALALRKLSSEPGRAYTWGLAALASCVIGFAQVEQVAPGRFARLLQVDVLQAIGASLCILALGQRVCRLLQRPLALFVTSALVALSTQPITSWLPGPLPHGIAGYLGKFEVPQGAPVPALFPLFPWLAYALAGAGFGALLRRVREREERVDRLVIAFAVLGAVVSVLTSEAQPFVHRVMNLWPGSLPLVRVAFRVGLVHVLLLFGLVWAHGNRGKLLLAFGQNSMRIYWVHMMFAYGILGRALQKKLAVGSWILWALPLFGAMWCLTLVGRPRVKAPPRPVRT
jgi:uncharacterized membrane protein